MEPYTEDMNQDATYWAPTDTYEMGDPVLTAPVLILCRWQDVAVNFRSPAGEVMVSSAVVYSDRQLATQGWLALGDHTAVASPRGVPGAWQVQQTGSSPDLDAEEVLHKNWL